MAFHPPTFNLTVNLWRGPNPVTNPPTFVFQGNLAIGRRQLFAPPAISTAAQFTAGPQYGDATELLLPKGSDIRGPQNAGYTDIVEVPAGTGRYYLVLWVDDVGRGFSNEYRLALLKQCDFQMVSLTAFGATFGSVPAWPVPTP